MRHSLLGSMPYRLHMIDTTAHFQRKRSPVPNQISLEDKNHRRRNLNATRVKRDPVSD